MSVCVRAYVYACMWHSLLFGKRDQGLKMTGPASRASSKKWTFGSELVCESGSYTNNMTSENLATISCLNFLICKVGVMIMCTSEL